MAIAPIIRPFNNNFYADVEVTYSGAAWNNNSISPGFSDVDFPFLTQGFIIYNETGTGIVEVSFDGVNLHDRLNANAVNASTSYDFRTIEAIWFRVASGPTPAKVSVRAWTMPRLNLK